MTITDKLIELIKSEETLLKNAVIVAKENKGLYSRMEELQKIFISLADEDATPWLSFSLALILLENVNWAEVIHAFENEELKE